MKKTNKGFTLVELIIVIAVIAILAGVLIPTFIGLVEKAQISNDTQLVRNLNTALTIDNREHDTMSSALQAAEECGFDVVKINATKQNNEILWDSVNDVFCYYNDETEQIEYIPNSINGTALAKNDYRLWKISDEVDAVYSTYLTNFNESTITTTKGIDAGECTSIIEINYVNTGIAQDVIFIQLVLLPYLV